MSNATEDTILVEYVGLKPQETDCVAGTKITWIGLGDVQEVPASAWKIMARHPDVWRRVERAVGPGLEDASQAVDDDAALRALARERGVKIDGRLRGNKLRAAIQEASPPPAQEG